MQFFIKAAEIWQLDSARDTLGLSDYAYGDLTAFEDASREKRFAHGEGLPGRTWAEARPLIWTDLDNGEFQRAAAAKAAGIRCGVSLPILVGDFLFGVVVLFLGESPAVSGVVEVWNNPANSETELRLMEGYYGELERFEWVSRRLTIMRGRGLPGLAWESGQPLIIDKLGESNTFVRARNARESGITTGLAIPFIGAGPEARIVTFLSAQGTPIARRFEIWRREGDWLHFAEGHGFSEESLAGDRPIAKGEGVLGRVWASGNPMITRAEPDQTPTLWLPVIRECRLVSVVGLTW